ncbi:MAG: hypothetical protein R3E67_01775 [Pseudomonadales bacterium]
MLLIFSLFFIVAGASTTATGMPGFRVVDKTLFRLGVRLHGQMDDLTPAFVRIDDCHRQTCSIFYTILPMPEHDGFSCAVAGQQHEKCCLGFARSFVESVRL